MFKILPALGLNPSRESKIEAEVFKSVRRKAREAGIDLSEHHILSKPSMVRSLLGDPSGMLTSNDWDELEGWLPVSHHVSLNHHEFARLANELLARGIDPF